MVIIQINLIACVIVHFESAIYLVKNGVVINWWLFLSDCDLVIPVMVIVQVVINYYDESEAILAQSSIHPKSLRVALVLARNGFQRF